MFKILSLALISLVGMNYANNSNNSIHYMASTPVVNGGTVIDDDFSGFLIPTTFGSFTYDGPTVPAQAHYQYYNYYFHFSADYIYFKTYSSYETLVDTRDLPYSADISRYGMQIAMNYSSEYFTWLIRAFDSSGNTLNTWVIAYIGPSGDYNGLERFYDSSRFQHYVFYASNMNIIRFGNKEFYGFNGDSSETISSNSYQNIPMVNDTRYRSLERYFYFPYDPTVYGYWYRPLGTYYLDYLLGSVGSVSRATIFDGFFKNQGKYYSKYQIDGINAEQPSNISGTNGWYFGPYNDITSLSSPKVVKPSSGTRFWVAQNGLFTFVSNGFTPVWYTLYTPVTSSGTTVNVLSDSYQWYSSFYQELYLVYEVVDTSGNLTGITDLSYYDMLSFNTGFVSNPGINVDPFTSALTLVGVAFQRVWSIGNIVLFGSITLNTLILMPILVGLVIFVIHLIKKG